MNFEMNPELITSSGQTVKCVKCKKYFRVIWYIKPHKSFEYTTNNEFLENIRQVKCKCNGTVQRLPYPYNEKDKKIVLKLQRKWMLKLKNNKKIREYFIKQKWEYDADIDYWIRNPLGVS